MVEKVLRMFCKLDLQEIPPLVYQLLLLSAKVKPQRELVKLSKLERAPNHCSRYMLHENMREKIHKMSCVGSCRGSEFRSQLDSSLLWLMETGSRLCPGGQGDGGKACVHLINSL